MQPALELPSNAQKFTTPATSSTRSLAREAEERRLFLNTT